MTDPKQTPIIRRRVKIDFDAASAEKWYLSKRDTEDFLNAISFFFPAGEKFFIESVQNFQDRITDPVLQKQTKDFIYQEAMHSKEHARCNQALNRVHPYGQKIAKVSELILSPARRFTPKIWQLALSCAIEHLTAILADSLLVTRQQFISQSDPAFAALWLWHAVEETEHKAVCFDVHQHILGKGVLSYLNRVAAMFVTSLFFLVAIAIGFRLIRKGGSQRHPEHERATKNSANPKEAQAHKPEGDESLLRVLKNSLPLQLYFDYYRPSFHPWNHDNSQLVEDWKAQFPDLGNSLDTPLAMPPKVCGKTTGSISTARTPPEIEAS